MGILYSALLLRRVQERGWRERKTIMLIVNDEQRLEARIASLSKRCSYCAKALAAYPLIVSDEARLQVYHAACAAALASEIIIDLYTFFRPPAPYQHVFVLDLRYAAPESVEVRGCSHRT
jgi:hypothetical protein